MIRSWCSALRCYARCCVALVLASWSAGVVNAGTPARTHPEYRCEPWPVAEALFRRDPRWRGGDGAASLDLGEGRTLWLFGDTFVAKPGEEQRSGSTMIRNSVAIQQGYDPTTAHFRAAWATRDDGPADFFPGSEGEWLWPGHGVVLDGELHLFFMRVVAITDWPKFRVVGWTSRIIENPADDPDQWRWSTPELPQCASTGKTNLGASSLIHDARLCVFGTLPTLTHPAILLAWPLDAVRRRDLSQPETWDDSKQSWVPWRDDAMPAPFFKDTQEEYTVHQSDRLGRMIQVQMVGFPKGSIAVRSSARLLGSWTDPMTVHTPEENSWNKHVFTYSAKAHPEQAGDGLMVTYCTNTSNGMQVFSDEKLYYPRVVRLFERTPPAKSVGQHNPPSGAGPLAE